MELGAGHREWWMVQSKGVLERKVMGRVTMPVYIILSDRKVEQGYLTHYYKEVHQSVLHHIPPRPGNHKIAL